MEIYLIGAGMGNPDTLTAAAQKAIDDSRLLIGAERLLKPYSHKNCRARILAEDIAACIEEEKIFPAAVLLSGDVGFYSGAALLRGKLKAYRVEFIPGISSLAYFCARLGIGWQDVQVVSAHGRSHNAVGEVQRNCRTFILTGSNANAAGLCAELAARGLGYVTVSIGDRLSYPDEKIFTGTAQKLAAIRFSNLAVMLVENPRPVARYYNSPGIPDNSFSRGNVPMTKQEVRILAVSKLRLLPHHTLWDVGAGTGSVSIECALAVPAGQVFAIEKNNDAVKLIEENKRLFKASNLYIVPGTAPRALENLPAPDRVFLGGSSGNLGEIIGLVLCKNPSARVVAAAVTLETLGEAVRLFSEHGISGTEIVQVAVTRAKSTGTYHMLEANNPVWLISGGGIENEE